PTVYNYAHLGNLRAFIFVDLLKRYLNYKKFKVKHVMNITDVDDKTIRDSKKEGKPLKEFTKFYEKEFLEDLKTLNIQPADILPRATEHIEEMVRLIQDLIKKGFAYEKGGSIYFSIAKFKEYGTLANLGKQELLTNAEGRLEDEYEKENARDFVLWKAYQKEDGDVFWDTELGKGRPGWHIECSAMSMKYLGTHFDIHTGGIDLIFPHHTNEIAQSECSTGQHFVNTWLHNAHLIVNGEKMSKSAGNFFTLRDLIKKGHSPKSIRYELLSTHYRQQLDFREIGLKDVDSTLNRFQELLMKLEYARGEEHEPKIAKLCEHAKLRFEEEMDDDLNIAGALAVIFTFIRDVNKHTHRISVKDAKLVKQTLLAFDQVLGVMETEQHDIPQEIKELAEQRLEAKKQKDWKKADELRNQIKEKGWQIDDTSEGYLLKKR
ncbi:MAG: cysteine--tRNA ligase, partial [Nanoarchaeota archaeon]|nr:cysteine--tRNA ligase [Nanoarchaeota archaeon]